jgi:predicted DNA helicase
MAKPSSIYLTLPIDYPEKKRERLLRRYGIKPGNISRTWEGDGFVLYLLKRGLVPKVPPEWLPGERRQRIRRIHEYIEEYRQLIELERDAERRSRIEELKRFSGKELESFGRAILGLRGRRAGRLFDLHLVRYGRDRRIETEISSGDIVLVSRGEPLKSDLSATVMGVGRNHIELAFTQVPPKWALKEGVRVDLFVNDVTFKRMENNLESMRHLPDPYRRIRDIVLELEPCGPAPMAKTGEPEGLNEPQLEALRRSLGMEDLFLIHGPPGTGKTTTLTQVIRAHVSQGRRVLAAADSNVAVDNLLDKLAREGDLRLIRVGHPARIDSSLERFSLMRQLLEAPEYQEIQELQRQAEAAARERGRYSKPTPARLRGMSRERVLKLAKEERSFRGVSVETIRSMARWIEEDRKTEEAFERLRSLESATIRRLLEEAEVVLATNSMVGSEALEGMTFDLAVVDEGSQQIEPSTLLPLLRAPRGVLAGDHRQLPPTVLSDLEILKRSLFERLISRKLAPATMLRVQYRMHETIMDFPNKLMYDGELIAHSSVARRTLPVERSPEDPVLDPSFPVVFADTSALVAPERLPERSTSYENPTEAAHLLRWVAELVACGIAPAQIGIITPYLAQVKLLRRLLEEFPDVEVKSVDGFQGREKEVILISFVRSNLARSVGFVSDPRRLNVAMTRARSKLLMIGDRSTLEPNEPFGKLFEWLEGRGDAKILKLGTSE